MAASIASEPPSAIGPSAAADRGPLRLVSPAVAARAAELGIPTGSLESLQGSGPGGRLRVQDLAEVARDTADARPARPAAAAQARPGAAVPVTSAGRRLTLPLSEHRAARARQATIDARAAADLTSAVEVDLTAAVSAVRLRTGSEPSSPRFQDELRVHLVRCVLDTLRLHPTLNAHIEIDADGGRTYFRDEVNLGVIASGPSGDVRAVIAGAWSLSEDELRSQLHGVTLLARAGVSEPEDQRASATFTFVDRSIAPLLFETPPLPAGSSGAIAIGSVEKRPLVGKDSDSLRVAWAAYVCLTYDHRLIDGADAARFLSDLTERLELERPVG